MKIDSTKVMVIISITIVIIFVLFIGIIWKLGLLTITGDDPNSKIVAASIALIGGLFSSVITIIGLILKHSIDLRSIGIQERNIALEKEAENRLKIEAAIKSIGLLSTSSGQEVNDLQKTGVILTLGNLNMFSLALSLSEELIKKSSLSMDSYTWLIDKCITDGDNVVREQAILCFSSHISKLLVPGGNAYFPATFLDFNSLNNLTVSSRGHIVDIIIDLITERPFNEWNIDILSTCYQNLYNIWKTEETYLKDMIGIALYNFLKIVPEDTNSYWGNEPVNLKQLSEQFLSYSEMRTKGKAYTNGLLRMENILNWCQNN